MKTALINLIIAVALITADLTIMYYYYNKANGTWDEIMSCIAIVEMLILAGKWEPRKHKRTWKNG